MATTPTQNHPNTPEQTDNDIERDQDRDAPRTAVPPGSSRNPGASPSSKDPDRDQDSDPPRTGVPPQ